MKKTNQLTAVEWLDDKIIGLDVEFDMTLISRETYWIRRKEILEQANNMFEQQIIDAYWDGLNGSINDYSESKIVGNEMIDIKVGGGAEQYYSETFKK